MRWLIRRLLRKGKSSAAYEDDVHYGEILGIGRATDQAIYLPDMRVALKHAQITALGDGRYKIESSISAGVRVNDKIEHSTVVGAGSVVEIGNTRLTLLEPPRDYNAGVEISVIDVEEREAEAERARPPQTLGESGWSKRRPTWLFVGLTLLFGLLLPLLLHFAPSIALQTQQIPLLSRTTWQSGPLTPGHQSFGATCQTCHETPFQPVQDQACLKCHSGLAGHADAAAHDMPSLGESRCAHCHRDHNGKSGLIIGEQAFCADCHLDLVAQTKGKTKLRNVADFSNAHPEFMVQLPQWNSAGLFTPVLTPLDQKGLMENSGLKFPHNVHLRDKGLQGPDGIRVLQCADCHRSEPGGALITPIEFEPHCQSCHRLDFDLFEPNRQVPHAEVPEIGYMLAEFYAKRALEGGYNDLRAPIIVRQRRRPGDAPLSEAQRQEALAWAREKSRQVADTLFESRACTTCHTVTRKVDTVVSFDIAPVRVAGQWFKRARFDHASHQSGMQCGDCHAAVSSDSSADLLLPGIDNCRTCHAGEHAGEKLESTCTMCHGFHILPSGETRPTPKASK